MGGVVANKIGMMTLAMIALIANAGRKIGNFMQPSGSGGI
jgi:hypothetical protein